MKAEDFEEILSDAEDNAETGWELDFVYQMREKHDQYGDKTYVTETQFNHLEQIASK